MKTTRRSAHRLSPVLLLLLASALAGAFTACASQSPDGAPAAPDGVTASRLTVGTASAPALDVLKRGGSFGFALDESAPSALVRERCTKESGGDGAQAARCYDKVRDEAATEGIRFSMDADAHLVWTSYGVEAGKEVVYLEAPLAVTADGDHAVIGTLAGTPHGSQIDGKPVRPNQQLHFEVTDPQTVVMTDRIKGRLVYHRLGAKAGVGVTPEAP